MKSPIWRISTEQLVELVAKSITFTQVLSWFGMQNGNSNLKTLRRRLDIEKIDYSHIPQGLGANRGRNIWRKPPIHADELFVENSKHGRDTVKSRIIKEELIPYKCAECGMGPTWNNKPLTLILDHKNGKNRDHRLTNLRFVCPNCDHQLPTFGSKNIAKRFNCEICGIRISRTAKKCVKCSNNNKNAMKRRVERPTKDALFELVWSIPTTIIAKQFGVTDKAVEKWCKSYGITKPGPGYWMKKH